MQLPDGIDWKFASAMAAGFVFVVMGEADKERIGRRIGKAVFSILAGFALSDTLAPWFGGSEVAAVLFIIAGGWSAMNTATALISDREIVINFVRSTLNKGGK